MAGRAMGSRRYWSRRVEEQATSGLSQEAFCRTHGLSVRRFCYWKYEKLPGALRRAQGTTGPAEAAVSLLPVRVVHRSAPMPRSGQAASETPVTPTSSGVEIVLPRGLRVTIGRGFDGSVLREVVEVLGC